MHRNASEQEREKRLKKSDQRLKRPVAQHQLYPNTIKWGPRQEESRNREEKLFAEIQRCK